MTLSALDAVKSKHRRSLPPKKAKKTREIKAPAKQAPKE